MEPLSAEFLGVTCRTPFPNHYPLDEHGRCAACRAALRGFDAAYGFGAYEGALRERIYIYKYGKVRTLARPLGELSARALARDERYDLVTPVPLHCRRRWERGFHQAELLARDIEKHAGIPLRRVPRRVCSTASQPGLSNTARRPNVQSAFVRRLGIRGAALRRRRILLVDDGVTTGSTAAACARTLKSAGAARVTLLTVARVDRPVDFTPWNAANRQSVSIEREAK
ncbi:MAG TPA: ComF family protein [Bryobacteraceae bacterium]|nr:ComF family protein [Bryobacteraceae bacterium]